jgi:hypothetical protein
MALFQLRDKLNNKTATLNPRAQASVIYHDIFEYPLTGGELIKWEVGREVLKNKRATKKIIFKNGFYFLSGKEGYTFKRLLRERNYNNKVTIARKAGNILNYIPSIKGLFITGALAMNSADKNADVDLLVITQSGLMWTSRALVLILLRLLGFPTRRFDDKNEKDKLCLNLWLDEENLSWPPNKRNIFSAHEIAQIKPIINKDNIYESFLYSNRWLKRYWPNSVRIIKPKRRSKGKMINFLYLIEAFARESQYLYMKRKITKEIVGKNKAVFHPKDISSFVLAKFEEGLSGA